jgi:type II secretory ATPase GspE/PulE/Tfp pilus assembly ATPase PilB-like protein
MDAEILRRLKINPDKLSKDTVLYHGTGCNACGRTGYRGRLPIFEFLVVDKEIRQELTSGASENKIRTIAREKGYPGLFESGVSRILAGLTTAEEVLNATFTEKD